MFFNMASIEAVPQTTEEHIMENSPIEIKIPNETQEDNNVNSDEVFLCRVRGKALKARIWNDVSKAIRLSILEKKSFSDSVDKQKQQTCLDHLQKTIKVSTLQTMVERLESISRQKGLQFTTAPGGSEYYINSDMFYIEVVLESVGKVKEVKIAHQGEPPTECPELTKLLRNSDFTTFALHLDGFISVYQLNADKKQKAKAYQALKALETDLSMLAQLQNTIIDPNNFVHKSPVGILQPRLGGFAMKLIYFISPYDLLDIGSNTSIPLTVENVVSKNLGHSVTVCIESSMSHKLQTTSLISISTTAEGKSLPSFAALSNLNSTSLPASFVLHLTNPIPVSFDQIKKIQGVTNIECGDLSTCEPLLTLITKHYSKGHRTIKQGLFVTLPDQHHCYHFNSSCDLNGVMVSSIPFTHPTHVPQILVFLRQQLLFNTLISSCVRNIEELDSPWIFELNASSIFHITIGFEHPAEESLATIELDLKDVINVKCKIFTLSSDAPLCTDEYASKVIQRCLSIPITMRAVIRKAREKQQLARPSTQSDLYCSSVPYLSHLPGYGGSDSNFPGAEYPNMPSRNHSVNSVEQKPFIHGNSGPDVYGTNPLLGNMLSQGHQQSSKHSTNAMLMSMLSDVPSGGYPNFMGNNGAKPKAKRKRKNTESRSPNGRSPKCKNTDDDILPNTEGESNDMSYDMPYSSMIDGYGRTESSNQVFPIGHDKFHPPDSLNDSNSINSSDVYPSFSKGQFVQNDYNTPELQTVSNYPNPSSADGQVDSCDSNSYNNMVFNPGMIPSLDRSSGKKIKKFKFDPDKFSEDSNNASSDDQSKSENSNKSRVSTSSPILGTSIKIAKSGDGLKVSKSEQKLKKKEGKRLAMENSDDFSFKKKSENKKERKRKRTEGSESGDSSKHSLKSLHAPLEGSHGMVSSPIDGGLSNDRGTSLNAKSLPSSKSPVSSKRSPSTSGRSGSPLSKVPKLQGDKSASSKSLKASNSETGNSKITLSKVASKHKTSSSSKSSNLSSSHSSGSKSKSSSFKLKNVCLPSSTTITPISSKSSTPGSPQESPRHAGVSITSSNMSPNSDKSNSSSSSKSVNKSLNRSKKGNLNAVINKLHESVTGSTQNTGSFGSEGNSSSSSSKPENANYKVESERRSKESSSKEFTVKPCSNPVGINLKIMLKKQPSEKSSSKLKTSSSKPASPMKSNSSKSSNSPVSKKISSPKSSSGSSKIARSHSPSLSSSKSNTSSSSSKDSTKSISKLASQSKSSSSGNNGSSSNSKSQEKTEKSKETKVSPQENKSSDKSVMPPETNLMPPPSVRSFSDHSRPSSTGSTPTRISNTPEERPSPRITPTQDLEEPESEKAFRILMSQGKIDGNLIDFRNNKTLELINDSKLDLNSPKLNLEEKLVSKSIESPNPKLEKKGSFEEITILPDPKPIDTALNVSKPETILPPEDLSNKSFPKTKSKPPLPTQHLEEATSSPEDSLVIDCPGTPRIVAKHSPDKKVSWASPKLDSAVPPPPLPEEKSETSPNTRSLKSPYQQSPALKSPAFSTNSPSNHSISSSVSRPSPCVLDDELMDEAVMGLNEAK